MKRARKILMIEKKSDYIEIKKDSIGHTKYSIVVPTYERPETLKNTIKSVLSQDYCGDYTVMIVDNNPTRNDRTELFMKSIADPRVSYYKNKINVGMVNNWNQCILAADCEWIVFVHDDDILNKSCLNNIEETISENPDVDAVLPNFVQQDNPYSKEKAETKNINNGLIKSLVHFIIHKNLPIAANLFCDNIYGPPTCGLTLRKKAVVDFGGYKDRCIAADWDFMSNYSRMHKIVKCKKQTGIYVWAVNASMKESTMEQIRKDRIKIIKEIIEYSRISRFYYRLLKNDFEKKFNTKTTDYIDYSFIYRILKKYYSLKI